MTFVRHFFVYAFQSSILPPTARVGVEEVAATPLVRILRGCHPGPARSTSPSTATNPIRTGRPRSPSDALASWAASNPSSRSESDDGVTSDGMLQYAGVHDWHAYGVPSSCCVITTARPLWRRPEFTSTLELKHNHLLSPVCRLNTRYPWGP